MYKRLIDNKFAIQGLFEEYVNSGLNMAVDKKGKLVPIEKLMKPLIDDGSITFDKATGKISQPTVEEIEQEIMNTQAIAVSLQPLQPTAALPKPTIATQRAKPLPQAQSLSKKIAAEIATAAASAGKVLPFQASEVTQKPAGMGKP